MLRKTAVLLAALSLALLCLPAHAQEDEGRDRASALGGGLFVGYFLGNDITELGYPRSNPQTMELDDAPVFGGSLYIDISERSRYELRLGFGQVTVVNAPVFVETATSDAFDGYRDVDANLFFLDLAYIPRFGFGDSKVRIGIPFGIGWGALLEDEAFVSRGNVRGGSSDQEISGGSGMSYFVGVQATMPIGERMQFVFDTRIKRYHRLTNIAEKNAQVVEAHLGVLWSF